MLICLQPMCSKLRNISSGLGSSIHRLCRCNTDNGLLLTSTNIRLPILHFSMLGSGRLMVAGLYFHSDYEILNDVSETAFTLRLIDWLARKMNIKVIKLGCRLVL